MRTGILAKFVLAASALACAGAVSAAAIVNPLLLPGVNEFQDTDAERIMRNGVAVTSGDLQIGDVIQTILRFDTINSSNITDLLAVNSGPLPNHYQLTGYAELVVAGISDCNIVDSINVCNLAFAPSGNLGAGVFVNIYERQINGGAGNAFSLTAAPATAIAQLQSQTLIVSAGLGDADDYWVAQSALDIGVAAGLTASSPQVANGVFGLSVLSNPGSLPVDPDAMFSVVSGGYHDIVGNASAYQRSPNVNTGWLLSSNTSVQFNVVPAPGSLALVGLGLMGVSLLARRRKAAASV